MHRFFSITVKLGGSHGLLRGLEWGRIQESQRWLASYSGYRTIQRIVSPGTKPVWSTRWFAYPTPLEV